MTSPVPIFEALPSSEKFYEMFSSHHNQMKIDPNSNDLPFIPYMKLRDPVQHARNVPVLDNRGRNVSKVSDDSNSTNDSFLPPSPISSNNDSFLGLRPLSSPWSSTYSSPSLRTNSSKESFSDASETSQNYPAVRPSKKHSIFSIDSILSKKDNNNKSNERKPKSFSIKRINQLSGEQPSKRKRTEKPYNPYIQPNNQATTGFLPSSLHQNATPKNPPNINHYNGPSTPVNHQNMLKAYVQDYYRMTMASQETGMPGHGFPTPPITPRLGWPMSNLQNIQANMMKNYARSPDVTGLTPPNQRQDGLYSSPPSDEEKGKRARTIFTTHQLERLEVEFAKQHYMVGTERYYLARQLNLKESQVKVWFQNRRIKWRKQKQQDSSQSQSNQSTKKSNFATLREQALSTSN